MLENGRLDTSWALVTMGDQAAAQRALAASPLEVAPGVKIYLTAYDAQAAAASRGGMQKVLARHQWVDTGRTVLIPLEWVRKQADSNGFALWHYFLEVCVGHFCLLVIGGRLATFASFSCELEAPWTDHTDPKWSESYNWFIISGTIIGKGGGIGAVLYCGYVDCRNKIKGHIPDHMRNPSGRVQVPCWARIGLMYICALVPTPRIVSLQNILQLNPCCWSTWYV